MPMNWDAATEAKLFSLLLRESNISLNSEMLKRIANEMGPECTPKAITHRVAKLKQLGATAGIGSAPATPKKTPAKNAAPTPKSGGKRKGKDVAEDDDEEPEPEDGNGSPKKKAKKATPKKVVKKEESDSGEAEEAEAEV